MAFSVADTGIGVAEEDQHRVFDAFAQVDNSLQSRCEGTGLGLSLASRPGVGSTFTLRLPVTYAGPEEAEIRETHDGARRP